jgi:hypothetical protein
MAEISEMGQKIMEDLSILRLGAVVAEDIVQENKEATKGILVRSFMNYVNRMMRDVEGEDWTFEEAYEFIYTDVLETANPFEAAYVLQQKVLAKSSFMPEKFRDPHPLRTVKDMRGMTPMQKEDYLSVIGRGI